MQNNNLFASTQYGFVSGRSSVSACADLLDSIYASVDQGYLVGLVLLDVAKAFDTVNHNILCRKLMYVLWYGYECT